MVLSLSVANFLKIEEIEDKNFESAEDSSPKIEVKKSYNENLSERIKSLEMRLNKVENKIRKTKDPTFHKKNLFGSENPEPTDAIPEEKEALNQKVKKLEKLMEQITGEEITGYGEKSTLFKEFYKKARLEEKQKRIDKRKKHFEKKIHNFVNTLSLSQYLNEQIRQVLVSEMDKIHQSWKKMKNGELNHREGRKEIRGIRDSSDTKVLGIIGSDKKENFRSFRTENSWRNKPYKFENEREEVKKDEAIEK